jgi:hypothetical protein
MRFNSSKQIINDKDFMTFGRQNRGRVEALGNRYRICPVRVDAGFNPSSQRVLCRRWARWVKPRAKRLP